MQRWGTWLFLTYVDISILSGTGEYTGVYWILRPRTIESKQPNILTLCENTPLPRLPVKRSKNYYCIPFEVFLDTYPLPIYLSF
jgi:hypothetical protein